MFIVFSGVDDAVLFDDYGFITIVEFVLD